MVVLCRHLLSGCSVDGLFWFTVMTSRRSLIFYSFYSIIQEKKREIVRALGLMGGVTLEARYHPVASRAAPGCFTKFLPKPVGSSEKPLVLLFVLPKEEDTEETGGCLVLIKPPISPTIHFVCTSSQQLNLGFRLFLYTEC